MSQFFQHLLYGTSQGSDQWITGVYSWSATLGPSGAHDVWLQGIGELWAPGSVGNAGWASCQNATVVATKAITYLLDTNKRRRIEKFETALSLAGTDPSDAIAPFVAAMVLLDSTGQLNNRSGRMYLPGPSAGSWDSGRIDATRWALLSTCSSKMLLSMVAGGLHPTVLQRDTRQNNDVTDIRASNKLAAILTRADAPAAYHSAHIFP